MRRRRILQSIIGQTDYITSTIRKVRYIESTGTQYIDTGILPNQDTRAVLCVSNCLGGTGKWLFGSRDAQYVNDFTIYSSTTADQFRSAYGTQRGYITKVLSSSDKYLIDKNKNVTTMIFSDKTLSTEATTETFSGSYNMYLFVMNNAGGTNNKASYRLHYAKIYDNGILVRDFVPALNTSTNKAGLYDKVSQTFFSNAGTGDFNYQVI